MNQKSCMQLFKEIFVDSSVQMVKTLFKKRSGIIRTLLFIQLIGYVNGILLPKLYCEENCSSDREKLLEAEKFQNFTRTIYSNSERSEQFLMT